MDMPPPYPMPPQPKSNTKLIWGIVIGVVSLCCIGVVALGFFGFSMFKKALPLIVCGEKFQDIHSAVLHYAAGHGGKLPKAETWEDDIQPDIQAVLSMGKEEERPFGSIKPGETFGCSISDVTTGIAFNSDLSGKNLDSIKDKYDTVLIYEIRQAMKNAHGPYKPNSEPAPMFMGAPREWTTQNVEGPVQLIVNGKPIALPPPGSTMNRGRASASPSPQ